MALGSLSCPANFAGRDPAAPRQRRRIGRASVAIFGSVAVHLALIALGSWSFSNQTIIVAQAQGGEEGGAITVTLVGPVSRDSASTAQAAASPSKVAPDLDGLFQKLRSKPSGGPASQQPSAHQDASELFKELAAAQASKPAAKQDTAASNDQAGDDLWPLIRPCWRPASNTQVVLDVQVDHLGRLTSAPTLVPANARPAGQRDLLAESLAIQAAVRCGPYRSVAPAMGAKQFRVIFRPSSAAGRADGPPPRRS